MDLTPQRAHDPAGPQSGAYRHDVPRAPIDHGALRRGTLAASVLDDIPLEPCADGVLVGRTWDDRDRWRTVSWIDLAEAVTGVEPESSTGRLRLRDWLRAFALLSQRNEPAHLPPTQLVALALPAGHVLRPTSGWVREQIGGAVLGVGFGLRPHPRELAPTNSADPPGLAVLVEPIPVPLPAGAACAAGVDVRPWWPAVRAHRDAMAVLASDWLSRPGNGVLRPIGGCDVLTLLSAPSFRADLASADGTGMRAVAAPMRSRGWFDLARVDPAFVGAAAAATDPELRGAERALLVTTDAVTLARAPSSSATLARMALADPSRESAWARRDVRYR